ncbi:hypothetical protein HY522_06630 [bacterium]|nr:hypothetical protein [bacterium]
MEAIIRQNARTLDRHYLDVRIQELSNSLNRPDILADYEAWLKPGPATR